MFPQRIEVTDFTESFAEDIFKVKGDDVFDAVLKTTLRAVLEPKLGDGESLTIVNLAYGMDKGDYEGVRDQEGKKEALSIFTPESVFNGTANMRLYMIDLRGMAKILPQLVEDATEIYGEAGWKRVERVTQFYVRDFDVICYINEELKSVLFLVGRNDVLRMHYITCSMPCWFPWYLSKETITKQDVALLSSLRKPRSDKFFAALEPFKAAYDFYSMRLKTVDNFENAWIQQELNDSTYRIERFTEEINDLYGRIANKIKQKEDACIRLNGLRATYGDNDSHEILDYLIENPKRVRYVESNSEMLRFDIVTTLQYWDPDYADDICRNDRSIVYTQQHGASISKEEMKKLFNAVFVSGEIKLKVCAQYVLKIRDYEVAGISGAHFSEYCSEYFPNTHIQQYHCLGAYAQPLTQAMEAHNYIGAIEQCMVSCASLNLTDTPVMEHFMSDFYRTTKKCLILPDGREVAPKEAIAYLNGGSDVKEEEEDG